MEMPLFAKFETSCPASTFDQPATAPVLQLAAQSTQKPTTGFCYVVFKPHVFISRVTVTTNFFRISIDAYRIVVGVIERE